MKVAFKINSKCVAASILVEIDRNLLNSPNAPTIIESWHPSHNMTRVVTFPKTTWVVTENFLYIEGDRNAIANILKDVPVIDPTEHPFDHPEFYETAHPNWRWHETVADHLCESLETLKHLVTPAGKEHEVWWEYHGGGNYEAERDILRALDIVHSTLEVRNLHPNRTFYRCIDIIDNALNQDPLITKEGRLNACYSPQISKVVWYLTLLRDGDHPSQGELK